MNREFLDVPGKKSGLDAGATGSEEEIKLGSRVSFANPTTSSGSQNVEVVFSRIFLWLEISFLTPFLSFTNSCWVCSGIGRQSLC